MGKLRKEKKDAKTEGFWAHHLEASLKSGMTQAAYCKQHGLSASAYYYWKRRLGFPKETPESLRFVPLELSDTQVLPFRSSSTSAIQISMGAFSVEARADIDLAHLENVLRVLGRLSCGK